MLELQYDGKLDVAVAKSHLAKTWHNKKMLWSEIVERILQTKRTPETYEEYLKMSRDEQSRIKSSAGGFVGAYLNDGKRRKHNVRHKQLITLDIDFIPEGENPGGNYVDHIGAACAYYPTHKDCPQTPRGRLLIPLSRPVTPEEYEAIARRVASDIGIEYFDKTTYEAERLMYWPTTSIDAEYTPLSKDAPWMDADIALSTYTNWKDITSWPRASTEAELVHKSGKFLGDPTQKKGVVGAFNAVYGMEEAIATFIPDVYVPSELAHRWTYTGGTTAAGLVIYNNHAYSHHSTDPVAGHAVNAFDLVRAHVFGSEDADIDKDTPINRLPSHLSMLKLASEDPLVKEELMRRKTAEIEHDFLPADAPVEITKSGELNKSAWSKQLSFTRKGDIEQTIHNVLVILEGDPRLKGKFIRNIFEHQDLVTGDLPWRKLTKDTKYLTDSDDSGLRHYLEFHYKITNRNNIYDAMEQHLAAHSFHPVRDYLNALIWDGTPRIDSLLTTYMGAEPGAYTSAVTRKTLVGAVARVMNPGCKFDNILVLVGRQGVGKSRLARALGGEWFSDSFSSVQGKEAFEQIQGVWILEMGELAGLKKAETETIKHFVSKQEDRYRVAYGRRVATFPRQCIFIGSTNNDDFLRDMTGNRRFWPVYVENFFEGFSRQTRDQIWAEAVEAYDSGEILYLDREMEQSAAVVQEAYTEQHPMAGNIAAFLDKKLPKNWEEMNLWQRRNYLQGDESDAKEAGTVERMTVSVAEICHELLGYSYKDLNNYNARQFHELMKKMPGWAPGKPAKQRVSPYGLQRIYTRILVPERV